MTNKLESITIRKRSEFDTLVAIPEYITLDFTQNIDKLKQNLKTQIKKYDLGTVDRTLFDLDDYYSTHIVIERNRISITIKNKPSNILDVNFNISCNNTIETIDFNNYYSLSKINMVRENGNTYYTQRYDNSNIEINPIYTYPAYNLISFIIYLKDN